MRRLNTQHGISFVDILVGAGVISMVVLATISLVHNQTSQLKTIMQNKEASDLHKTLMNAFSNSDNCTCLLNPSRNTVYGANLHFDSTLTTAGRMDLHELFIDCDPQKHPMSSVAIAGQPFMSTDPDMKVSDVLLDNIKCTKGPQHCTGVLTVKFDTGGPKSAIHPVTILEQFTIDNKNPSRATVSECTGVIAGSGPVGDSSSLQNWPLAVACTCEGISTVFQFSSTFKNGQQSAIGTDTGMKYVNSAVSYSSTDGVHQLAIYYDHVGDYVVGPGAGCKFVNGKAMGVLNCPAQLHLDGRHLEF